MQTVTKNKVRLYFIDNVDKAMPDWELTFDTNNHALYGSALIEIVTNALNELYKEMSFKKQIDGGVNENDLLDIASRIVKKIGQLAN